MTVMPKTRGGTPLYQIQIPKRPSMPLRRWPMAIACTVLHPLGHVTIHVAQMLLVGTLWPFRRCGFRWAQRLHDEVVRWTKGCYALLMLVVTWLFAPTEVTLSLQGDNLRPEDVLVRNADGRLVGLNLPKKLVVMANHQVYSDWMYLWGLMYFSGHHMDVFITLKKSLKYVPIVGWSMQIFNFIFLERSWKNDKTSFIEKLAEIGKRAEHTDQPLALFLFPEGTLVSDNTRKPNAKYASDNTLTDFEHTLLPRSTGMHFALRSLLPRVPDLHLLDATIIYPGIPKESYGQLYYTLRSIWIAGVPPPRVHIHLRMYSVRDLPIGSDREDGVLEIDGDDRKAFTIWMMERFSEKNQDFDRYYDEQPIPDEDSHVIPPPRVEKLDVPQLDGFKYSKREIGLPMRPRSAWEILDAFALPGPLAWGLFTGRLR